MGEDYLRRTMRGRRTREVSMTKTMEHAIGRFLLCDCCALGVGIMHAAVCNTLILHVTYHKRLMVGFVAAFPVGSFVYWLQI